MKKERIGFKFIPIGFLTFIHLNLFSAFSMSTYDTFVEKPNLDRELEGIIGLVKKEPKLRNWLYADGTEIKDYFENKITIDLSTEEDLNNDKCELILFASGGESIIIEVRLYKQEEPILVLALKVFSLKRKFIRSSARLREEEFADFEQISEEKRNKIMLGRPDSLYDGISELDFYKMVKDIDNILPYYGGKRFENITLPCESGKEPIPDTIEFIFCRLCSEDLFTHLQYEKLQVLQVKQIIDALIKIKEKGLAYPDLHALNILIEGENSKNVYIADLGMLMNRAGEPTSMVPGGFFGPPECLEPVNEGFNYDALNVYQIGTILVENYFSPIWEGMINTGQSPSGVLNDFREEANENNSEYLQVIAKMLEPDPVHRPSLQDVKCFVYLLFEYGIEEFLRCDNMPETAYETESESSSSSA